jgi:hypothetical protein
MSSITSLLSFGECWIAETTTPMFVSLQAAYFFYTPTSSSTLPVKKRIIIF